MLPVRGIFCLDVETDKLHGRAAFAIAAVVRDEGKTVAEFQGRAPLPKHTSRFVKQVVLPALATMKVTHDSILKLEEDFWDFWMNYRDGRDCVAYFGNQGGEAALFNRLILRKYKKRWVFPPAPLHEICTLMRARDWHDIHHMDKYMEKFHLCTECIPQCFHHPLFDAHAGAIVWEHLLANDPDTTLKKNTPVV